MHTARCRRNVGNNILNSLCYSEWDDEHTVAECNIHLEEILNAVLYKTGKLQSQMKTLVTVCVDYNDTSPFGK